MASLEFPEQGSLVKKPFLTWLFKLLNLNGGMLASLNSGGGGGGGGANIFSWL